MAPNPPQPPKKPDSKGGRPSVERASALRDVMAAAVETEKEMRKKVAPPTSGAGRALGLTFSIPALLLCVYSLAARPEFIWGPNRNSVSEVRRDANVRFTLYLLSRQIETFKKKNGSYPSDLAAVNAAAAQAVRYAVVSNAVFELRAADGPREVVFRSDAPLDQFLGRTPTIVQGRGRE